MTDATTITITPEALEQLLRFRDGDGDGDASHRCLYARVAGVRGDEYLCALSLESPAVAQPGDLHEHVGALAVVVAAASVERLRGSTVDWCEEPARTGFVVHNPNRPQVDGVLVERVRDVLERELNPSIALHGGRADLVAVEGRTAYVRLSGGCQGCGMASATLTQGIEATLTEAVPEIVDVVDVTDHAAGTNPYYAPA